MNCPNCGREVTNQDATFCPYCAKPLRLVQKQTGLPSACEPQKKSRTKLYGLALMGIIIASIVVGYYFWQQNQIFMKLQEEAQTREQAELDRKIDKECVDCIYIKMSKFSYTKDSLYFTADIELTIWNDKERSVTLDRATTTLYINGINVQTKSFQNEVLIIPAYGYNTYSGTFGTFDAEDVASLQDATSYSTKLDFSAMGTCGTYTGGINNYTENTWYPQTAN